MSGFYSTDPRWGEKLGHFGTNCRSADDITIATPAGAVQASRHDAEAFMDCLAESLHHAHELAKLDA